MNITTEETPEYVTVNGVRFYPDLGDLTDAEPADEINVSGMFVGVFQRRRSAATTAFYIPTGFYISKDELRNINDFKLEAIVTVKDWQDIQAGKRNLIVGEGL